MTREEITHILVENFEYLASEYGIAKIGLFGSYVDDNAHKEIQDSVVYI